MACDDDNEQDQNEDQRQDHNRHKRLDQDDAVHTNSAEEHHMAMSDLQSPASESSAENDFPNMDGSGGMRLSPASSAAPVDRPRGMSRSDSGHGTPPVSPLLSIAGDNIDLSDALPPVSPLRGPLGTPEVTLSLSSFADGSGSPQKRKHLRARHGGEDATTSPSPVKRVKLISAEQYHPSSRASTSRSGSGSTVEASARPTSFMPAVMTCLPTGSSPGPWDCVSTTRSDDQRLAHGQCMTDSIVNIMCEFAAAHLPGAHFVSSLILSAAASLAERPNGDTRQELADFLTSPIANMLHDDDNITRLVSVAHYAIGDSTEAGHYAAVLADARNGSTFVADSLSASSPGLSRHMLSTAVAGVGFLCRPPFQPGSSFPSSSSDGQNLDCLQQANSVDCGIYAIVNCLGAAATSPRKLSSVITAPRKGSKDGQDVFGHVSEILPSRINPPLWRAVLLAMLRHAPLLPVLAELKVVAPMDDDEHHSLLYTQAINLVVPRNTPLQEGITLLQQQLDHLRSKQEECVTRIQELRSVVDDLNFIKEQIFESLQRRRPICRLAAELRIRKLEKAVMKMEEIVRLTASVGVSTPLLSQASRELPLALAQLKRMRRRQINLKASLEHGHDRVSALKLQDCVKWLETSIARYEDTAGRSPR